MADPKNTPLKHLLFVGDSLIEHFDWQGRLPAYRVSNMGLSGETVTELLSRTHGLCKLSPHPDWLLIMIGTNNLWMNDFSFMPDYEKIIEIFQAELPGTKITINSIFPIQLPWLSQEGLTRTNTMLQELAGRKKIKYLDGGLIFAGAAQTCFEADGVHLSGYGYQLWADAIAAKV